MIAMAQLMIFIRWFLFYISEKMTESDNVLTPENVLDEENAVLVIVELMKCFRKHVQV